MKNVLLIVNPSSGGEKAKEYEASAKEKLASLFDKVEVKRTEKAGDAENFAAKAAQEQYHSVFTMGGDGTVNEAVNGLAGQENRPNFGFFPLGTVNDLARALNMPLDPKEAISSLDITKQRHLDIGKINDRYFTNVVAIGAIPEGINQVDTKEKTKFGKMAYFISGAKQLSANQSYQFKLTIDGEEQEIESSTLLIGLTNSIGGFESLIPNATIDDGKLHLLYLKDQKFLDTVKTVPDLLKGITESTKNVAYLTAENLIIEVLNQAKLATNVDGDPGAALPVKIQVLPAHLTVYSG
ncbi:diacylglycerol kinase family lipid kinase [Enterococcus sp. 669A]|uniref:Diacylglycerol kinase family lipid kinase n=1 Tax=Candidatus Enterococcus moelleringii TaxID=2815325 RepID=A0ABS3L9Q3_9ENTE|nr:diacylglycerol kinase family protein [Enterococcus sp. 669A]MBO1306352.1 diacylglycerol kinase family lipid kinase [Enterococcus sp. 669A]